jgi:hypothetical protein
MAHSKPEPLQSARIKASLDRVASDIRSAEKKLAAAQRSDAQNFLDGNETDEACSLRDALARLRSMHAGLAQLAAVAELGEVETERSRLILLQWPEGQEIMSYGPYLPQIRACEKRIRELHKEFPEVLQP